ncbi:MAG: hypothetical protein R8M45_06470 [Ghiorsea sp.]
MVAATIFDRLLFTAPDATGFAPVGVPGAEYTETVADANAQAVRVRTVKVAPSATAIDRPLVKGTMGAAANLVGKKQVQVDVEFELRGSGTAGTAPEYSDILAACGLSVTAGAGSVAIAPADTATTIAGRVALRVFYDGMLWEVTGCAGTATVDMTVGNVLLVQATLQGAYTAPVESVIGALSLLDPATGGAAKYIGSAQPIVVDTNHTLTIGGATIAGTSLKFDLGNDVQEHYTTAQHVFSVSNRNPTLSITQDSVGTAAEWANLSSGQDVAVAATMGVVAFSALQGRRSAVSYGERAERDTLDISFGLFEAVGGAGNDQFAITITG